MVLRVFDNSGEEIVTADNLVQGQIGKVAAIDQHPDVIPGSVGSFLVRGSRADNEGALLLTPFVRVVQAEHLYHYRVLLMPKGFVLSLEVI